jgi:hypothetical protein
MRTVRLGAWLALAFMLLLPAVPGMRAEAAQSIALLGFELVNTSPAPTSPQETRRLASLDEQAAAAFAAHGYEVVDTTPIAGRLEAAGSLRGCNGCDIDLGRALHADLVAFGWVQKVSNLILNINLEVHDIASGRLVDAGSVDIRGNTDESWRRGLDYLLKNRIFRPAPSP